MSTCPIVCFAMAFAAVSAHAIVPAPVVAAYTNDFAILEFDRLGRVARLADRHDGRSLVRTYPALDVVGENGVARHARVLELTKDGRLRFRLYDWEGEVDLGVRVEPWGFVFTVERCTLKGASAVRDLTPMRLWFEREFARGVGEVLCGASNERHTVVLRSYDLETRMRPGGCQLAATVRTGFDPVGQRIALCLAPREQMTDCLKKMTVDSGCFYTKCGGAWSLEAPENRRSYLFAHFSKADIDDWIDLAERGGFATLHASGWWKALGHYEPNPRKFPNGEADLKACVDRANAAGLAVSTHTLCSGIAFNDPWITPVCNTNVLALYTYTLAAPLADDAKELVVNEKPGPRHDVVTTYFSCGNILRVGTELMTYESFTTNAPYAFRGLKRGAYGTRRIGAVPAGARVDYVFQHFMTLFPDPKTPFGVEMAQHLCSLCNRMGFALVYQDGAEPFSPYDVALNRLNFTKYLDQSRFPVQIEASTWNSDSWWFHSSVGAWDHPVWAMKRFHDKHINYLRSVRRNNYLSAQLGWWNPRLACDYAEGHYVDDIEYFAAKNAAWDFQMSIQGVTASAGPLPLSHDRQMTVLGWYEHARLAKAFAPEALALMRRDRGETRLRQDAAGRWTLTAVTSSVHRVGSSDFRRWRIPSARPAKAAVRVKALFGAVSYDSTNAVDLVGADDAAALKATASKGVSPSVAAGTDPVHGRTLKIAANNASSPVVGSWMRAELRYTHPFRDARLKKTSAGGAAFGFWLKGDGSGALLSLQLATPSIFVGGTSDHVVKLDFTGWRYVQLFVRERDAETYCDHVWPEEPRHYALYRQALNLERIETVRLSLAEIPAGGRTAIELSQVKILPTQVQTIRNASVEVGGTRHALPFELQSGDFAELDDGIWTRYSLRGEALQCAPAADAPAFAAGANDCAFAADCAEGDPRAEVAFFLMGETVSAFVPQPVEPEHLGYEAVRPMPFDPAKGFAELLPVRTRPGEDARLEFTVYGAVKDPSVRIGGATVVIPVTVPANAKLVMKDDRNWQVVDRARKVLQKGTLAQPLPILRSGETAVFSAAAGTDARFSVVKRYGKSVSRTLKAAASSAATSANVPWRGCAVTLSPDVMWARGGFGDAMAFDGKKATGEVVPSAGAADGWTVTAWVRATDGNRAKAPWTLAGETVVGKVLPNEQWTFVAVRGTGKAPVFGLGTDGTTPFKGFVDDLEVRSGRLSDAAIGELSSDAEHVEILGYQDDGTGGVQPIRLVPQE